MLEPEPAVYQYQESGLPPRYRILDELGRGGMGIVYKVLDLELGRELAIKVMSFAGCREEKMQARFLQEAKTLASLSHHNIIRLLSFGISDSGDPYHVLEFFDGITLSSLLAKQGRLSPWQFEQVFAQALSAIAHAHKQRVLHRDLKPSNLLIKINADGSLDLRIIDFGIAKILEGENESKMQLTSTRASLGSPAYMSPEQCSGLALDERSDIYSLACIMYECISGKPVFEAETAVETMYKHANSDWVHADTLVMNKTQIELAQLVDRCLAKNPEERASSAENLLDSLKRIMGSSTASRALFKIKDTASQSRLSWSSPWLSATAALLILALLLSTAVMYIWKMKNPSSGIAIKLKNARDSKSGADSQPEKIQASKNDLKLIESKKRQLLQLEAAYAKAVDTDTKQLIATEYIDLADSLAGRLNRVNRNAEAEKTFASILKYADYAADPVVTKTSILRELAVQRENAGDYKAALAHCQQALALLAQEKQNDGNLPISIALTKLDILVVSEDFKEARVWLRSFRESFNASSLGYLDKAGIIGVTAKLMSIWRNLDKKFDKLRTDKQRIAAIKLVNEIIDFMLTYNDAVPRAQNQLDSAENLLKQVAASEPDLLATKEKLSSNRSIYLKRGHIEFLPSGEYSLFKTGI